MTSTTGERAGGPSCRTCRSSEARCAWRGQCCRDCTHFATLDAAGNDRVYLPKPTPIFHNHPICPACHRRVSPRGRGDCPGLCAERQRAYWRDRERLRRQSRRSA